MNQNDESKVMGDTDMNFSGAIIFVVDDDEAVRTGLSRLIRSAGWQVEAVGSALEFLERAPGVALGCVVLDVHMPGMAGPELHDRMAANGISLPVIFLTGRGDVATGISAMKKGAIDFLLKPVDDEVLLQAIAQSVGLCKLNSTHAEERGSILGRFCSLSGREREVLLLVLEGLLNKQIAARLGIAEKTVKVHRGRVMEKMHVRSVAQLVHLCEIAGISAAADHR